MGGLNRALVIVLVGTLLGLTTGLGLCRFLA